MTTYLFRRLVAESLPAAISHLISDAAIEQHRRWGVTVEDAAAAERQRILDDLGWTLKGAK